MSYSMTMFSKPQATTASAAHGDSGLMRGVVNGAILSLGLWIAIGYMAHMLFWQ